KRLRSSARETTRHRENPPETIPSPRQRIPAAEIIAGHYTCDGPCLSEALHVRRLLRIEYKLSLLLHVDHREEFAVHQRNRDALDSDIALHAEELCRGQRCLHLVASKPRGSRRTATGAGTASRRWRFACIIVRNLEP